MYSAILNLLEDASLFKYSTDDQIPEPNSCANCGKHAKKEGMYYTSSIGLHRWIEPSDEMRLKRMIARRNLKSLNS